MYFVLVKFVYKVPLMLQMVICNKYRNRPDIVELDVDINVDLDVDQSRYWCAISFLFVKVVVYINTRYFETEGFRRTKLMHEIDEVRYCLMTPRSSFLSVKFQLKTSLQTKPFHYEWSLLIPTNFNLLSYPKSILIYNLYKIKQLEQEHRNS